MCGIGGILSWGATAPFSSNCLATMARALAHRGPDGEGTWTTPDGAVGFVHTRLSITDHSALGRQPMRSPDGQTTLVFNGEIYNHASLRRRLAADGFAFKSASSDSEVILHAYRRWGTGCAAELSGMFAFAVWDQRSRRLILARDALGIKPLYFAFAGSAIVFASEIRALWASTLLRKELCEESLFDYLTFLSTPAPQTLFRNIFKLEPGCLLSIAENGETEKIRFWDSAAFLNTPIAEEQQTAEQTTSQLLNEAVDRMTSTTMPLVSTLSGGVDSALIAALLRDKAREFTAVTMDYEQPSSFSESARARRIADVLGIPRVTYKVSKGDLVEAFRELTARGSNEPLVANDALLLSILAKDLRQRGIRICLMGEGADELGGYPSYFDYQREYGRLSWFASLPRRLKAAILGVAPPTLRIHLEIASGNGVSSRRHVQGFSELQKYKIWRGKPHNSSYDKLLAMMAEVRGDLADSFLRKVQHLECRLRLPEFLMARADGSTMAHGVEVRLPFLDQALVEYSLRLPMLQKMSNGIPKSLFRSMLSEHLPAELAPAHKIGFGRVMTPFLDSMTHHFRTEIMGDRQHPLFEYLNRNSIQQLLDEHRLTGGNGYSLWLLYTTGTWLAAEFGH